MLRRILAAAALVLAACTDPQPCPRPLEECDGQCVDVQSNPAHCGSCGVACAAACVAGRCAEDFAGPCHARTGGAFVTLGFDRARCRETAKLWVSSAPFVDEAAGYVASTVPARTPRFTVLLGTDCDAQWTWHVQAATPAFVDGAAASCADVCPGDVQADVPGFVSGGAAWCPSDANVLAVDPRPAP